MSLPAPMSTPATTQEAPTPRSGSSARPLAVQASRRTNGTPRSVLAHPARTGKARTGFASVLDAVQHEVREGAVVPTGTPVGSPQRCRDVQGDQATSRGNGEGVPPPGAHVDASSLVVQAPTQTPWLLIALGSGSNAWLVEPGICAGEGEDVAAAAAVETDLTVATAAGPVAPVAFALPVGPAVPGGLELPGGVAHIGTVPDAAPPPLQAVPAVGISIQPDPSAVRADGDMPVQVASDELDRPTTLVVAGDRPIVAEPSQAEAFVDAMPAAPTAIDSQALRESAPTPRGPAVTRKDPAGWSGLALNVSSEDASGTPVAAQPAAPAPDAGVQVPPRVRPPSRAAEWLSQAARNSVAAAPAAEPAVPGVPAQVSATVNATPGRTTEALLRLAQASDGASSRPANRTPIVSVPFAPTTLVVPATAEVAPPMAPQALPPAVGEQVLHQVVSSLRMQWRDGIGEAKLQLRPDALGAVSVSLRVEAGAVTAVVRAESAQVQEWVVQNQETLRQQMEAAGLHLGELVVTPDGQGQEHQRAPQEQRRRRQAGPQPSTRFETLL